MAAGLRDADRKCSRDTGNKMAALSFSLPFSLSLSPSLQLNPLLPCQFRGAVTSSYRVPHRGYTAYLAGRETRPPSFSPVGLTLERESGTKLTLHCPYSEDRAGEKLSPVNGRAGTVSYTNSTRRE